MMDSIKVSAVFPVPPEALYRAWLSSEEHSAFTGSTAVIDPREGKDFTAWDGYIQGKTLALEPYTRIVQSWRTTDFPAGSKDSRLEVLFEEVKKGTRMTLVHTDIPDGQGGEYRQGWEDYYIAPMKEYFID
jgi:activator of HSP90 ATPase